MSTAAVLSCVNFFLASRALQCWLFCCFHILCDDVVDGYCQYVKHVLLLPLLPPRHPLFFALGDARFITVTKKKANGGGGGADRAELPPILHLGQARGTALEAYFARRPPAAREMHMVMSAAVGGGMHAAAELATQKRHKVEGVGWGLIERIHSLCTVLSVVFQRGAGNCRVAAMYSYSIVHVFSFFFRFPHKKA